jgi:predicted RecB family nuclease
MPTGKKKDAVKEITKTPEAAQIADIEYIEGIGPEYGKALKQVGINTTEDLRKMSLVQMAEVTDISPKLLYKWQCIADLFRVRRAAQQYSEFIFEMGIETVKELSEQKTEDLFNRIQKFYETVSQKPGWHGKIKKLPTLNDVELWISSAKELVKKN